MIFMNDRNRRIDEFLKYFRDIALQNPGFRLNHRNVYNELTRLGLPKNERNKEINHCFSRWIDDFKYDSNCDVFVSPDWQYFCQFISKDGLARRSSEHLKVYIPLDSVHIERGAKEVFEFLSKENISHLSKIGSHVRFDDIVVRLVNKEDVIKLVEFINNNKYIQEGLMLANPFTFSKDGIPMAVDGSLSFNSTVASLIEFYINDKIDNNALDIVGVDDFYQFVHKYYNYVFSSSDGLERLTRDFSEYGYLSTDELVNYKNVFELLLNARKDNFTLESYFEHYDKCVNPYIQSAKIQQLNAIKEGCVIENLNDNTVNEEIEDKKSYSVVEKSVILIIQEMLEIMMRKYGRDCAYANLTRYIYTGEPTLLTRDGNLRERVVKSSFRRDLINILNQRNIKLEDYLNVITETSVVLSEVYLEQAILETYYKYEKRYQDGLSYVDGKIFVIGSLSQLIKRGNYNGFTRDNNVRMNLESNVPVSEVINVIKKALNIDEKEELSYFTLLELIKPYVDLILENNRYKNFSR